MKIDMPLTTQDIDSSGEVLSIEGHDISDFLDGKAWANWEHSNDSPEDIVGRFTYAHKILTKDDCENDRQRMYWDQIQKPFVYGVCELLDDVDHPGGVAVAALIRYFVRKKEKIRVGASIEGSTLERDDNVLKRSVGRRAAITLAPCNKQCWVQLLEEVPETKTMKSERVPSMFADVDSIIVSDTEPEWFGDLTKAVSELRKSLEASGYNAAPGTLTQGAALAVEGWGDRSRVNRMKAAFRDWPRTRPLKEWLKAELPDVSDQYLDHFAAIAQDASLKKGLPPPVRIGAEHSTNQAASDDQKKLVSGLYLQAAQPHDPGHEEHRGGLLRLPNDAGQEVMLKPSRPVLYGRNQSVPGETAHLSTAYHAVADRVFGMGQHVPVTNHVAHPMLHRDAFARVDGQVTPGLAEAIEFQPGHQTMLSRSTDVRRIMHEARMSGQSHKLALMDHVLGADGDRHEGNVLVGPDGTIKHIDNAASFVYGHPGVTSVYHSDPDLMSDPVPEEAAAWLDGVDRDRLAYEMRQHGLPHGVVRSALARLDRVKRMSRSHPMVDIVGRPMSQTDEEAA